jgi:hypothetical protein
VRVQALLVAAALCAAAPALAQVNSDQSNKRWRQADACVADANKKVPDHDLASQQKRDQLANDCMKLHKLPPLTNSAPTTPPAPATPPSN